MTAAPSQFRLHVGDDVLADLKSRLGRVRWPDEVPDNHWKYGTDLPYLKSLMAYWRDSYDWRKQEAEFNRFNQYKVRLAGIDLHYIREEGKGPKPMPLLISHGWPGSVHEFHKLIPMLTDPARFGGNAADAFTVVAPSLPGYAFSFTPNQQRFGVEQIADVFAELMQGVLGYKRFAAQGGDWGAFVTSRLGFAHPQILAGIHINLLSLRRDTPMPENPDEDERRYFEQRAHWMKEETGYTWIQGTKPQTLAYGLTDSPVGLAAWIVEKFHTWSDHKGNLDEYIGRDAMLTNIMLYWVTGAIGSSFWPYYSRMHGPWPIPDGERIKVPMGYAEFPKEILRPPRSLAEKMYADIRRWTRMPKGGHFAALEQPELLAHEIREFFRPLR
ncbi:MAG TPA: epoxide hydrolase [Burkholderiales bacterium]|nr:epoxide hydrolase [Burkholderiales bacterium]